MSAETESGGSFRPSESSWRLPVRLHRAALLLPPLLLACLEIFHPQPEPTVQALLDVSTWFAVFHVIQLVLIGLIGLSVMLLADGYGGANSWATRLGLGTFLVFFSAYDTLAGIGTGLALRSARQLSPVQQEGVVAVVQDWPGLASPFALSIVGTLGWVVAVGSVALTARGRGAPRREWVLIALAAVLLLGGHPFPAGTLAFGCFFAAALLHELAVRPATRTGRRSPAAPGRA
jgi:hypothetical protein